MKEDIHPYLDWIKQVENLIDYLMDKNFESGTPDYFLKKSLMLGYDIFKFNKKQYLQTIFPPKEP